ncbi:MAG: phage holin family protein [Prevotellaceae bacterium]|jgi:putative membrane protein|nr:phage holin family protein [Prevotellaceae bacterium]
MNFIIQLLISALAVYFTAWALPGISIRSYWTAIGVALVIGLLDTFLKPVLIFFTIPITIITFGLFLLVINALIIMLTSYFFSGFQVNNFWWALLFSIIVSVVSSFLMKVFDKI